MCKHTLHYNLVKQDDDDKDTVMVYVTLKELEKLKKYKEFLEVHHYPKCEFSVPSEKGKIEFLAGPTIRFHLKEE